MASINFEGVRKVFADGTVALDDLDLEVADGEFMVLVGAFGSSPASRTPPPERCGSDIAS
jgi:ABC-type sugar transport system ATPase subunit